MTPQILLNVWIYPVLCTFGTILFMHTFTIKSSLASLGKCEPFVLYCALWEGILYYNTCLNQEVPSEC